LIWKTVLRPAKGLLGLIQGKLGRSPIAKVHHAGQSLRIQTEQYLVNVVKGYGEFSP
jgi:hypothetical protein